MSDASASLAKSAREYVDKSLDLVHEQAARIAEMGADIERMRTLALLDLDARKELEAEIIRLRCCGNCEHHDIHHDPYGECTETCETFPDYDKDETHDYPKDTYGDVLSHDRCHISTSHWTTREP